MNKGVKIIISIVLGIVGFLCLGLWPYIPGAGVPVSIGLFSAAIIGIVEIWKTRPVEGEGDIFKDSKLTNDRVKKINAENDTLEKQQALKLKINQLVETNVLNQFEAEEKIKSIDKKIENIKLEIERKENDAKLKEGYERDKAKLKEEYERDKANLDILKKEGILTGVEYVQKLEKLRRSMEIKLSNGKSSSLNHSLNNFDINSLDYQTEIFDIKNFPKLNDELQLIRPFVLNNDQINFRIILFQYVKHHSIESKYYEANLNIVNAIVLKQIQISELETLFRRYKKNENFIKALELEANNILSQPLI